MMLHGGALREGHLAGIRGYALWSIPRPARAFLLAAEALAVAGALALLVGEPASGAVTFRFVILLALTIGYGEVSRRSERVKRYLGAGRPVPRPNPLSIWSFAALLVLPVGWAAVFIAAQYAHTIVQRWREQTSKPHRQLFVAAAAMLAQLAAGGVLVQDDAGGVLLHGQLLASVSVVGAAVVFTAVDFGVMLAGRWLTTRPPSIRMMLPDGDALGFELACLAFGVAVAALLLYTPWLVIVMIAPVAYLHRSSMVKTLHQASRTDSKTGLLNPAAWTEHACGVLSRCARTGRTAAVMIIDVDHFKAINDQRGHLVGDRVLVEVARTLQRELRGHDGLGRFGGDEFVVTLEELAPAAAEHVAQRLLTALGAIRVDDLTPGLSIGLAHTGQYGPDLTQLLAAADGALYAAKASGRGRMCIAPAPTR